MLPLFAFRAFSYKLRDSVIVEDLVSRGAPPKFQDYIFSDFGDENNCNVLTKVSGRMSQLRKDEYFCSSILVDGALFRNNFAFGSEIEASGYGGALFLSHSSLFLENNFQFVTNKAELGGAVCTLMSTLIATVEAGPIVSFTGNKAFISGGAIFFQGGFDSKSNGFQYSEKAFLSIQGTTVEHANTFKGNTAGKLGGALFVTVSKNVILDSCIFNENKAGISGGAIYSKNANMVCNLNTFVKNQVNFNNKINPKLDSTNVLYGTQVLSVRGGGAIYYSGNLKYITPNNEGITSPFVLATTGCCFLGDSSTGTTDFNNSPGHEIMLSGYVKWDSYTDNALIVEGKSFGRSHRDDYVPDINVFYLNTKNVVDKCPLAENVQAEEGEATVVDFLDTVRNEGSNSAKKVPSPSIYTFQATPEPETPYATTSSWTKYSSLRTVPSMPSVKTARETLFSTPFSSPFRTPFSSPFRTPFSSPASTPFSSPARTPASTPFSSPARTQGSTSSSSPSPTQGNEQTTEKPMRTVNPTPAPSWDGQWADEPLPVKPKIDQVLVDIPLIRATHPPLQTEYIKTPVPVVQTATTISVAAIVISVIGVVVLYNFREISQKIKNGNLSSSSDFSIETGTSYSRVSFEEYDYEYDGEEEK